MNVQSKELTVTLNGRRQSLAGLDDGVDLERVVASLGLKADRVAIELNGEIARRTLWGTTEVRCGDKLEIVHFVGGGRV
jgi:sulfur carrier protein